MLVLSRAVRLARQSVDVLMDRTDVEAEEAIRARDERRSTSRSSRAACACATRPARDFADLVVGCRPTPALVQAHAVADASSESVRAALPGADVVVHVEPRRGARATCASAPPRRR